MVRSPTSDNPAMTSDIDIWRAAKLLIERYGEDASIEAAMRADEMLEQGDMTGKGIWIRILKAVKELQSMEPTGAGELGPSPN